MELTLKRIIKTFSSLAHHLVLLAGILMVSKSNVRRTVLCAVAVVTLFFVPILYIPGLARKDQKSRTFKPTGIYKGPLTPVGIGVGWKEGRVKSNDGETEHAQEADNRDSADVDQRTVTEKEGLEESGNAEGGDASRSFERESKSVLECLDDPAETRGEDKDLQKEEAGRERAISRLRNDGKIVEPSAERFKNSSQQMSALPSTAHPMCIFYDRPPRTGSTTISSALMKCLRRRYTPLRGGSREARPLRVQRMLAMKGNRIGVYHQHLYINAKDVADLKQNCRRLLYITSCKPMRERIWSAAKYRYLPKTSTLNETMKQKAINSFLRDVRTEPFLENYPYLDPEERPLKIAESDKLVPDYVIRADRIGDDLGKLLTALRCPNEFASKNVHETSGESDHILERIELRLGDTLYRRLAKLAEETNKRGLCLASSFV